MKTQPVTICRPDQTQKDRVHSVHNFVRAYEDGRLTSIVEKFRLRAAISKTRIYWEGSEEQIEFDAVKKELEIDAAIMLGYWDLVYRVVDTDHYKARMMYLRHQLYWWSRYHNDERFCIRNNKLVSPVLDVCGNRVEFVRGELRPDDAQLLLENSFNPEIRKWLGSEEMVRVRPCKKIDPRLLQAAQELALKEAMAARRRQLTNPIEG